MSASERCLQPSSPILLLVRSIEVKVLFILRASEISQKPEGKEDTSFKDFMMEVKKCVEGQGNKSCLKNYLAEYVVIFNVGDHDLKNHETCSATKFISLAM